MYRSVDEVWTMSVSPEEAVRRLHQRNGLADAEARARLASQLGNAEREAVATRVFDTTDREKAETRRLLVAEWAKVHEERGWQLPRREASG